MYVCMYVYMYVTLCVYYILYVLVCVLCVCTFVGYGNEVAKFDIVTAC